MARPSWSDRPLGVKLSTLVIVGALALGVFALISVRALQSAGTRTDSLLSANEVTGLAMEADMMHDAVRADVLQALLSGSGPQYTDAASSVTDHGQHLRDLLGRIRSSGLAPSVAAAVGGVSGDVDTYLASAQRLVTLAGRDAAAARAGYPAFEQTFTGLEKSLPTVGEAIGTASGAEVAASRTERSTAIRVSVLIAVAAVLLLCLLGWVVTRSVVRPLRRVSDVVSAMADGDLRGTTGITSRDEVGRMAVSLEVALGAIREVVAGLGDSSTTLASATEELSASAQDMTRLATESSAQSGMVAAAAGQVSDNVRTVAAGSEELGASIREIAQNASDVAQVAARAVAVADDTTASVAKLGASSLQIAEVVKVITGIAEQTNLLALNATIEAARAGESGKGFAVVANEVKELAQETAKATQDITTRVEAIQADTDGAVRAIGEIAGIIGRINDAQGTIASAVEEQTATTTEMNRNVAEAAVSADQIAENIGAVAGAAASTTQAMDDARAAIDEVARLASTMHVSVARFRY